MEFPVITEKLHQLLQEMAVLRREIATVQNGVKAIHQTLESTSKPLVKVQLPKAQKNYLESDMQFAVMLLIAIKQTVAIKDPKLNDWANTFRLLRTADRRSDKDVRDAIESLPHDTFWNTVCLSAASFRKHFDRFKAIAVRDKDKGVPLDKYRGKA